MSHNGNGSNDQSQSRNGTTGSRPAIPKEVGDPDCPVCLSRVQNRAYTDTCLHEFCYPCVKEWSRSHNRCPVCREVYRHILHNIRTERDYDREEVEEPIDATNGVMFILGDSSIVFTPPTGAYYITPRPTPYGNRYNILFLGPNHMFIFRNFTANSRIVVPDRLEQTLHELGARPYHSHNGRHPHGLSHHNHRQRSQQRGGQQKSPSID